MGIGGCGGRLLECDAAKIYRIQFAQRYWRTLHTGVRIRFFLFTTVLETRPLMSHTGLTVHCFYKNKKNVHSISDICVCVDVMGDKICVLKSPYQLFMTRGANHLPTESFRAGMSIAEM